MKVLYTSETLTVHSP